MLPEEQTQDVNTEVQSLPAEQAATSSSQTDNNIPSGQDVKPVNPQVDEHGVSYYDRYMESQRKAKELEEELQFKNKIEQSFQPQPQATPQQPPPQPLQIPEDALRELENSGDPESVAKALKYRQDVAAYNATISQRQTEAQKEQIRREVALEYQSKTWDEKTKQSFPEILDKTSKVYQMIAEEFRSSGNTGPKAVWNAAQEVKRQHPELFVRETRIPTQQVHQQHIESTNIRSAPTGAAIKVIPEIAHFASIMGLDPVAVQKRKNEQKG